MTPEQINQLIKESGVDTNAISDGYHTFGELYAHRIALFIAFCNTLAEHRWADTIPLPEVWKSRKQGDGSSLEGWFIAGIDTEKGKQISYHLPNNVWELLGAPERERAPEWDGHTPDEVIQRLYQWF